MTLQAESILNMKLRSLRKLEEMEIRQEMDRLKSEEEELQGVISSEDALKRYLVKLLKDIVKKFPDQGLLERKTMIEHSLPDVKFDVEDFVQKEKISLTLSKQGWIRAFKGHDLNEKIKYRDGDSKSFIIECTTLDKILFFSSIGKVYCMYMKDLELAKVGSTNTGDPLRLVFDLEGSKEKIISVVKYGDSDKYILASTDGYGFVTCAQNLISQTRKGKQILNVQAPNSMIACELVRGNMVGSLGENRRLIIFKIEELPSLKRGKGIIIQRFKQGKLKSIRTFEEIEGLTWKINKRSYSLENPKLYFAKRGAMGRIALTKLWIK